MENLAQELKNLQDNLEGKSKAEIKAALDAFEAKNKGLMDAEIKAVKDALETEYKAAIKVVQDHADQLDAKLQEKAKQKSAELKDVHTALAEAMEEKAEDIAKLRSGDRLEIKVVGTMTTSNNLSGDPQVQYNNRQGIKPGAAINMRDLIPTVQSNNGMYVTYRETGSQGGFDWQTTEANAKAQVDYSLTEVKLVTNFLAGFASFSRQMLNNLPWLQTGLNRMLLRDFYAKENTEFYSKLATAATGPNTSAATVGIEQLIDYLMAYRDTNYNPAYIIVSNADYGKLAKTKSANYATPFVYAVNPMTGQAELDGIPLIRASWATAGKALIIDTDFVERVEVVGLNLRFSEEEGNNFTKNLITARLECQEELAVLLPAAISYGPLAATT